MERIKKQAHGVKNFSLRRTPLYLMTKLFSCDDSCGVSFSACVCSFCISYASDRKALNPPD
jgi:hypothetical protein